MRFIHMADAHLGASPDAGMPWSEARRNEIWETFRQIIQDAGNVKADLLLIAGDLFHRQPLPDEVREVNYLFSTLRSTRVVLIAGNHDYIDGNSPYLNFPWSPNVVFLQSNTCECVRFPEIRTEVYGFSYDRQEITEPMYDALQPVRNSYTHILLAHGGDTSHIPINRDKLAQSGFDYIALGHIHKPGQLIRNRAFYSGSPEPLDCTERGAHGYILGEIHGSKLKLEFVRRAKREYKVLKIASMEGDTTFSLADQIDRAIDQEGQENIYEIILEGSREPEVQYDTRRLMERGLILSVEDQTRGVYHLQELKKQYRGQMIGRYIESFERQERGEVQEKALQYGLEALMAARRDRKR